MVVVLNQPEGLENFWRIRVFGALDQQKDQRQPAHEPGRPEAYGKQAKSIPHCGAEFVANTQQEVSLSVSTSPQALRCQPEASILIKCTQVRRLVVATLDVQLNLLGEI